MKKGRTDSSLGAGTVSSLRTIALFFLFFFPSFLCAQEKIKLPASVSSKTLGYSPMWVAQKQGFFNGQGLDVDVVLVRSGEQALMALLGGSVYFSGGGSAAISAVENGADLVFVGGVINGLTHMIMGAKRYKSFEDLRGATIGTSGLTGGTAIVLRRVLKAKGLEYPRDYKLMNVGASTPAFTALTSGQIAAAMMAVPLSFEAADMGYNIIGRFVDFVPKFELAPLIVRRSWAEKNRPIVVRFLKAMIHTYHWLYNSKEAAINFLSQEMQLKPSDARRGWEYYIENKIWDPNGDVTVDGIRAVMETMADQGQLKLPLPSPLKYVDQSYLREALKELGGR